MTCATLREDEELRKFFETLISSYLNSHSQYARIDILNCPGMYSYLQVVLALKMHSYVYTCSFIIVQETANI